MLENVLYGKVQYLKMVKGEKDPVYSALQARYNRLTSPLNAEVNQNLDYLRSFTISEFEEIVGSPIQYCLSKDKNLYGKSLLDGKEIIISITGAAKHELAKSKIITDETLLAGVKSVDFNVESKSTPGLYVILTAKNGGSPFWLMTYYDPTVTEISLSSIPATELIDIWEKNGIDSAIQAFEKGTAVEPEKKQNKVKKKTNAKKSSSPIDIVDMGIDDLFIDDIDGYIDEIGYMDDGVDFSFEDM
jgi:hypothetical protein